MGSRLAAALAAASLLFVGGAALGAEGDPYLKTCLSTTAAPPCVAASPTFQGGDAEVSPDGRHLYAAVWKLDSSGWTGIRLYDIGADGALTQRTGAAGCYAHLVAGCTNTPRQARRGSSRASPASTARSAQSSRGRVTWRRSTATSWRSMSSSTSLVAVLLASSASHRSTWQYSS